MAQSFETLSQLLEQSAGKFKDNDLFGTKQPDGSWTWLSYGDFAQLVARCRGGLRALGVGPGDRVAIVADNRVEWATAAFASYGIGAEFVPMYPAQPPKEWEYIINDCSPKVVFASGPAHPELQAIVARTGHTTRVIGLDLPKADEASFEALLAGGSGDTSLHPVTGSDIAGLVYTSGTTGNPKGVMLTHSNFCTNVIASGSRFEFDQTDRALCFLPWAHSYGQTAELYTFISIGASMAINDEVPNLVDNLAVVKPTVLVAVPRIFNRIYDRVNKQMDARPALIRKLFTTAVEAATAKNQGKPIGWLQGVSLNLANKLIFKKVRGRFGGRLRFVVSGSAALSTEVAQFIDALGIDVFEGYGLTETSPVASTNYPQNRKIGSVGKALPDVSIRIDTEVTGEEKVGEIIISGPNVMQGYYNKPEETAAVLLPDGSFRTGDLGYLDDEGYLFITGRIKEQYKLETGKYVAPSVLEEQLKLSRYILNVMLYGANKPYNVALVVLDVDALKDWAKTSGVTLGDPTQNEAVRMLIKDELAHYGADFKNFERPSKFVLITEDFTQENGLLTPSMKLKRRHVLAKYEAALEALYST